jgi:dolichyl-phosphate-mannose--protein O-mannosyl transferase
MFDEVYHAFTAGEYVAGNPDAFVWGATAPREGVAYTWNHPPAGLLLIAAGIITFGDDAWGWRLPSAAFGALGLVVLYLLALRLTGSETVALLAASLLLFDGLYFAQSRSECWTSSEPSS